MNPIGILGGTFDPIHYAHLRLAQEAADALDLGQVRFVPAGRPYHRDTPQSDPAIRLEMVRLAIAGNPRFCADDRDIRRESPTYTVDTLSELRGELGREAPLVLILGGDAFARLTTWQRWRELFELAHIAVAHRPGSSVDPRKLNTVLGQEYLRRRTEKPQDLREAPAGRTATVPMTALDISGSRIRALIRAGKSPRYLLPESVLDYIQSMQLYRAELATGGQ